VWEFTALSDSQCASVSRSICLLVTALSMGSLSQNRSKGPVYGINSSKFSLLFQEIQFIYIKQISEFIFSGMSSQRYAIFDRKKYIKK